MKQNKSNLKIVNKTDHSVTDGREKERFNKQMIDRIVLEEDFVPYIVPNIYVSQSYGNKLSFREGNESFLNVI